MHVGVPSQVFVHAQVGVPSQVNAGSHDAVL
jgi:hypothetical protein